MTMFKVMVVPLQGWVKLTTKNVGGMCVHNIYIHHTKLEYKKRRTTHKLYKFIQVYSHHYLFKAHSIFELVSRQT